MKYKARLQRLLGRQKFYDSLPNSVKDAYTRPGSKNK